MNLEKIVYEFLEREDLVDKKIGVAVSGGVDSVVLLDLVQKCLNPEQIFVLHINHQTRSECDTEQYLVEKMCKTFNINYYCKKIDNKYSKNKEANWRKERRDFFEKIKNKDNLTKILTAHHATDLVETMIWRLTKGTGISGLSPFDVSNKPLWKVPKTEIVKYAEENNLKWCEDESNMNTNFERNKIRHEIIPILRTITPNLEQVYIREAEHFSEAAKFIENQLPDLTPVDLKKFLEWSPTIQKEFLRRISKKTPSADEVADCLRWLQSNPRGNTKKELGNTTLRLEKGKLLF